MFSSQLGHCPIVPAGHFGAGVGGVGRSQLGYCPNVPGGHFGAGVGGGVGGRSQLG